MPHTVSSLQEQAARVIFEDRLLRADIVAHPKNYPIGIVKAIEGRLKHLRVREAAWQHLANQPHYRSDAYKAQSLARLDTQIGRLHQSFIKSCKYVGKQISRNGFYDDKGSNERDRVFSREKELRFVKLQVTQNKHIRVPKPEWRAAVKEFNRQYHEIKHHQKENSDVNHASHA